MILDINNAQEQLVSYGGNQLVGFYDGYKAGEPVLYIYIKNNADRFSIVRRRAGERKVKGQFGDLSFMPETTLYKRAYDRYLELKAAGGVIDAQKEALIAKVAELEAKAKTSAEKPVEKEVKKVTASKTAAELKDELDELGVEYKGNSSKESLLELLASNK